MAEFKYGLFISFILFVWMIIEYTLLIPSYHQFGSYIGFISVCIPIAGIYLGVKEKRNKTNFGYITFGEAFKTGMIITAIIAVMNLLFVYVYYEYVNPEFVNYLAAETERNMLQDNSPREEINAAVIIIRYQYSLNIQLIQQVIFIVIGGAAISFVVSMILKKVRRSKPIEN